MTGITPGMQSSFIITVTPELAEAAGVPVGSRLVFSFEEGSVTAEILPPVSDELREEVRHTVEEFGDVFEEMKRRGD
jgi:hypothetical protein